MIGCSGPVHKYPDTSIRIFGSGEAFCTELDVEDVFGHQKRRCFRNGAQSGDCPAPRSRVGGRKRRVSSTISVLGMLPYFYRFNVFIWKSIQN